MAKFTMSAAGEVVLVDLPEGVVPTHRSARRKSALYAATLPDGRTAWVAVKMLVTQRDGTRYATVHYGQRLYNKAMERVLRQSAVRRSEADLMYRVALAA